LQVRDQRDILIELVILGRNDEAGCRVKGEMLDPRKLELFLFLEYDFFLILRR
jgi:hypothetical protein